MKLYKSSFGLKPSIYLATSRIMYQLEDSNKTPYEL